jgi:hypothetical protein
VAEYLSWQLRNALALRGVELLAFAGFVISGVGLYYSLKFLFRSLLDAHNARHALVLNLQEDRMAIYGFQGSALPDIEINSSIKHWTTPCPEA